MADLKAACFSVAGLTHPERRICVGQGNWVHPSLENTATVETGAAATECQARTLVCCFKRRTRRCRLGIS